MLLVQPFGPEAPARPRLAHSLRRLGAEVDALWPDRARGSDGWLGDEAHSQRSSDHNPDRDGIVHAVDLTTTGVDRVRLLVGIVQHPGVAYVIHRGLIYSRSHRYVGRPYDGPNAHHDHVHVSILHTHSAERSPRSWLHD